MCISYCTGDIEILSAGMDYYDLSLNERKENYAGNY